MLNLLESGKNLVAPKALHFNGVVLYLDGTFHRGGCTHKLTEIQKKMLKTLMASRRHVLDTELLIKAVYGENVGFSPSMQHRLASQAWRLNKKMSVLYGSGVLQVFVGKEMSRLVKD